jgi:hypothetical protein
MIGVEVRTVLTVMAAVVAAMAAKNKAAKAKATGGWVKL